MKLVCYIVALSLMSGLPAHALSGADISAAKEASLDEAAEQTEQLLEQYSELLIEADDLKEQIAGITENIGESETKRDAMILISAALASAMGIVGGIARVKYKRLMKKPVSERYPVDTDLYTVGSLLFGGSSGVAAAIAGGEHLYLIVERKELEVLESDLARLIEEIDIAKEELIAPR